MAFLPLRKLPPAPGALMVDAWLERLAGELAAPDADRSLSCRRTRCEITYPEYTANWERAVHDKRLPLATRAALLSLDPRNVTLELEYYAECDDARFQPVRPLLWLWYSSDRTAMSGQHVDAGVPLRRLTGGAPRRPYSWLAALALALAAGACSTYWPTLRGSAAAPAPETYRCAVERVRALGYRPVAFNEGEGDMDARRENRAASARLPGERRQYDVLVIHAAPATGGRDGEGSTLSVRAETIVRHFTRAGWIEDGQPASPGVQAEARQIIERCAK